jgi:hypothetical protein
MEWFSDDEQQKSRVCVEELEPTTSGIELCQPCQQGARIRPGRAQEGWQVRRQAAIRKICEEEKSNLLQNPHMLVELSSQHLTTARR